MQLLGEVAVFTHHVLTRATIGGDELERDERQTIVFTRQADARWIGVHEHLSPTPSGDP